MLGSSAQSLEWDDRCYIASEKWLGYLYVFGSPPLRHLSVSLEGRRKFGSLLLIPSFAVVSEKWLRCYPLCCS